MTTRSTRTRSARFGRVGLLGIGALVLGASLGCGSGDGAGSTPSNAQVATTTTTPPTTSAVAPAGPTEPVADDTATTTTSHPTAASTEGIHTAALGAGESGDGGLGQIGGFFGTRDERFALGGPGIEFGPVGGEDGVGARVGDAVADADEGLVDVAGSGEGSAHGDDFANLCDGGGVFGEGAAEGGGDAGGQ